METYCWSTEESHPDNHHTLCDYIDHYMPEWWECEMLGTNEAKVITDLGETYQITARGNGDSFNHAVEFTLL